MPFAIFREKINEKKGGVIYLTKQECDKTKFNIPKYEIEALARAFLLAVLNYYRTEEGKKDFESWKNSVKNEREMLSLI